MSTFVLIHGAGDVGWYWHLVEEELRRRGHDTVAPDLPSDDQAATLDDYSDAVIGAIGDRTDPVVVGQSYGGFTAALVAGRVDARALVFVAGMIPAPGEAPAAWWEAVAYPADEEATDDAGSVFYHDVPPDLAAEAARRTEGRGESAAAYEQPWPLDALPDVPTRFVLCTEDRFFPPRFMRRVVHERLGVEPDEIAAGHCVALSRPVELAALLDDAGSRAS